MCAPQRQGPGARTESSHWYRIMIDREIFQKLAELKNQAIDAALEANAAAMAVQGVAFASSNMSFLREEKYFASSDGVITDQTVYKAAGGVNVTAVSPQRCGGKPSTGLEFTSTYA